MRDYRKKGNKNYLYRPKTVMDGREGALFKRDLK